MAQYDGMVLTNDGINLLAKCQLGQKIEFTKVLIGDGRVPEGKTFQEMTALVNTKLALGIQNVDFVEDGRVDVTAIIDNNGLEVGFFVREIGLFAKQVGGADVLYAYTNAGDLADYLPNAKVNEVTDQIVVQSIITNKENVVINLNDNFVVATKADLKKHDESVNVHVNLMDAHNADEGAHEPAFTAHNEDEGAHESRFQQYIKKTGDVMSGIITHTAGEMIMNSYRDDMNLTICGGTDYGSGGHLALYGKNTSHTGHGKGAAALCAVTDEDRQDLVVTPTEAFFIEHMQSENQVYKYIVKTINGVNADKTGNVDLTTSNIVCLVESAVNADGSWYRKYSDGWLEQGGNAGSLKGNNRKLVTLLKPMADMNYTILMTPRNVTNSGSTISDGNISTCDNVTTTTFHAKFRSAGTANETSIVVWYAFGQGA